LRFYFWVGAQVFLPCNKRKTITLLSKPFLSLESDMKKRAKRSCKWFLLVGVWLMTLASVYAQTTLPKVRFVASENQQFGFDDYQYSKWDKNYRWITLPDSTTQRIPYKSMLRGSVDHVNLFLDSSVDSLPRLRFQINDSVVPINYKQVSRDTLQLELPSAESDYILKVYYKNQLETALQVVVFEELRTKVKIVPLTGKLQNDSLTHYLNQIFAQAGLSLDLTIAPKFNPGDEIDSIFANPSADHDRYTEQMMQVRDAYFDEHGIDDGTYYVFVIAGFVSSDISGYMVRNKGVSFVKRDSPDFYREIARQLGYGIGQLNDLWKEEEGPTRGSMLNLMDDEGTQLTHEQWQRIRSSAGTTSYYDDFEDVRANNGIIAYYLWEENEDGTIRIQDDNLLGALKRPFKRNTYSLYLNIDNFLFIHLFEIWVYPICALHLIALLFMAFSFIWVSKKTIQKVGVLQRKKWRRRLTRVSSFLVHTFLFWLLFLTINEGYYMFEVDNGKIESLAGASKTKATRELFTNQNVRRNAEEKIGSEVLIKRGEEWVLEKRKPVLYFNVSQKNGKRVMRFSKDSNQLYLPTKRYRRTVQTHYFVFRYLDESEEIVDEKAFNHLGLDITDKLELEDPAERIVLFVNGYRPTSLGNTFEDNFKDVRRNGLEFPKSSNVILRDDSRYEYWKWNNFDGLFARRLNATGVYYADGHHSVSTSNHESLVDFTRHSLEYPKRCKNPNHHVCKTTKRGWKWLGLQRDVPTYETHPLDPNEDGFNIRRRNGEIAGRNLLQLLNEIPSNSDNDTLYIVAHSMGYAYALGIIDKMRGRINFGGFYIIAAENAESGSVNENEWEEIWQYGGDFEANKEAAPCLLDGIAPQTKVDGLSPRNRVYIPEKLYSKMGFFESHFIGHYTWIFDIPQGESGHVPQR